MSVLRLAACLLALTGCGQISDRIAGLRGASAEPSFDAARSVLLFDGALTALGPDGYCVDGQASDVQAGFVMMAGCAMMSEDEEAVQPTPHGLITVQFGAAETASVDGQEEAFASFLESEAGRAMLSETGSATEVDLTRVAAAEGRVIVSYATGADLMLVGTTGQVWRGFADIEGRLVTVTVHNMALAPLSDAEGPQLVQAALTTLIEANSPQVEPS